MNMNNDSAGEGGRGGEARNPNTNRKPNSYQSREYRAKSCKGILFYSSVENFKSNNPTCIGFSRTFSEVPFHIDKSKRTKVEHSMEGRTLLDMKYACIGYSLCTNDKDPSADLQGKTEELPSCVGLQMLMVAGPQTAPADRAPVPAPAHKSEDSKDERTIPQPERYNEPPQNTGEEYLKFLYRFKRSAGVVASGVAKNLNRVGKYVRSTLEGILYSDGRRSK